MAPNENLSSKEKWMLALKPGFILLAAWFLIFLFTLFIQLTADAPLSAAFKNGAFMLLFTTIAAAPIITAVRIVHSDNPKRFFIIPATILVVGLAFTFISARSAEDLAGMIILPLYGGITISWCVLIVSFALPPLLKSFPQKKSEKLTRNKSALISAIITFALYITIIIYRTITILSNSWAKNDPLQAWRTNVSWVAVLLLPVAILLFFILWGITTNLLKEKEAS